MGLFLGVISYNKAGFTLSITVLDELDVPVNGADVHIDGNIVTTNSNGLASISNLAPNVSYPFTITKSGFVEASGSIQTGSIDLSVTIALVSDYSLRDTGPSGGLITYINSNSGIDGWKYIETASSPVGGDTTEKYSNVNLLIGTTGSDIGDGTQNTIDIVGQAGFLSGVAKACDIYNQNGYSDWFLPSVDELMLLYNNLHVHGVGGFTASSYWSSTEAADTTAYRKSFGSATAPTTQSKSTYYRYRPVRRFIAIPYNQVTYLGNGNTEGTIPPSINRYYPVGSDVVVANGTGLVRGGDNFVCWNTRPDGFGVDYDAGSHITINGEITLYARYQSSMMVFLPDTQSYVQWQPEVFTDQVDWINNNRIKRNIRFVGHVGDLVEDMSDVAQWAFMQSSMNSIGANTPYSIIPGNHDYAPGTRDSSVMNTYFPLSTFTSMATFGGAYDTNSDNTYHTVDIDGVEWLVISLEMGPREAVINWANGVISSNPSRPVILVTHAYIKATTGQLLVHSDTHAASNGYGLGSGPPSVYDGIDIWNSLVKINDNVKFVICGHDGTNTIGSILLINNNDSGHPVYQIMSNFQYWPTYPGYLVALVFDSTGVTFRTLSVVSLTTKDDDQSQGGPW